MDDIFLVMAAIGISFLAWYWWQARVRQSKIERLRQATADVNKHFEGTGYRIDVTECADGSVQTVPNVASEELEEKLGTALRDGNSP